MRNSVKIYDKRTVLGLEFNYVQGVNTPNYADDMRYNELKKDLDNRVELLKLAVKRNEEFYSRRHLCSFSINNT
jgi:hypothetical protein